VPMVDSEVVRNYDYGWWVASWGKAEIDYLYIDNEHIYSKNYDSDTLEERYTDDMTEEQYHALSADERDTACKKYVANLLWEKVIAVEIEAE
jgi:hypothetical protein